MAHTNRLNATPASTNGFKSAPVHIEALFAMGGSHAHWQRSPGGRCQSAHAVHPFSQKSVHRTHFSLRREDLGIKNAEHI